MTDKYDDKSKPFGQRLRDYVNTVMAHPQAEQLQYELLDNVFEKLASALPKTLEKGFGEFRKQLDGLPAKDRPLAAIDALTTGGYDPIMAFKVGDISTGFTRYRIKEIKKLDGYIRLHEILRDADVYFNMANIGDDLGGMAGLAQPMIIVNPARDYRSGALENPEIFPYLPEKNPDAAVRRRPKGTGSFEI